MKEDASRHLARSYPLPRLHVHRRRLLRLDAPRQQFGDDLDAVLHAVDHLHHLRCRIEEGVGDDGLQPQFGRRLPGPGVELVEVIVQPRQGTDHVGLAVVMGPLGRRVGHTLLVGHLPVVLDGVGEAIGGHNRATDEGVLVVLVERDVLRLPLELRPGEGGEEGHRLVHVGAGVHQPRPHLPQFGLGGEVGEAADGHGDGVSMAATDHGAEVAGELLDPQRPLHHLPVALHQGNDGADAEEIGGYQVIDVQNMAVNDLAVEVELAQQHRLLRGLHAQRPLGGAKAGRGVAHGADAADAGGDVAEFMVRPTAHEGLEEAGGLDDLKATLLQFPVPRVHDDVAMPLDTGHMMYADLQRGHLPSSSAIRSCI